MEEILLPEFGAHTPFLVDKCGTGQQNKGEENA